MFLELAEGGTTGDSIGDEAKEDTMAGIVWREVSLDLAVEGGDLGLRQRCISSAMLHLEDEEDGAGFVRR